MKPENKIDVWFTSDMHLGNGRCAATRKLNSSEEHDYYLTENINSYVPKRGKLYILGDAIDSMHGIKWAKNIQCQNIELIIGNHDQFPLQVYTEELGWKVHGFKKYRDFWLSHPPIHPHEIREQLANIHGHVHEWGDTYAIDDPRYFNVNPEFHQMKPVCVMDIYEQMEKRELPDWKTGVYSARKSQSKEGQEGSSDPGT